MIRKSIQARPPASIKTPARLTVSKRRRRGHEEEGRVGTRRETRGVDVVVVYLSGVCGARVLLVSGSTILSPNPSSAFDN